MARDQLQVMTKHFEGPRGPYVLVCVTRYSKALDATKLVLTFVTDPNRSPESMAEIDRVLRKTMSGNLLAKVRRRVVGKLKAMKPGRRS